jgi:hypothetical protein
MTEQTTQALTSEWTDDDWAGVMAPTLTIPSALLAFWRQPDVNYGEFMFMTLTHMAGMIALYLIIGGTFVVIKALYEVFVLGDIAKKTTSQVPN